MPDSAVSDGLADLLRTLAQKKVSNGEIKARSKESEADYRAFEARVVDEMTSSAMRSCVLDGVGSFALTSTVYSSIKNLTDMIRWATENQLINPNDVVFRPDGRISITFDVAMVEDDGDTKPALVSGIVRADAYKAPLNEHVKASLAEGSPEPPGVKANIKTAIRYTPRRTPLTDPNRVYPKTPGSNF